MNQEIRASGALEGAAFCEQMVLLRRESEKLRATLDKAYSCVDVMLSEVSACRLRLVEGEAGEALWPSATRPRICCRTRHSRLHRSPHAV